MRDKKDDPAYVIVLLAGWASAIGIHQPIFVEGLTNKLGHWIAWVWIAWVGGRISLLSDKIDPHSDK